MLHLFGTKAGAFQKIAFGLSLALIGVGGWLLATRQHASTVQSARDHEIVEWELEGKQLKVEVVNSAQSIQQGLSGREQLEVDGMLFVLAHPQTPTFWMKEMRFPIDIVWIYSGKVVGIEKNVQPPGAGVLDQQLEVFSAPQLVDMVLETRPGRLQQ